MTCDAGKVCYPTRAAALKPLPFFRQKRKAADVYYCDACQAFHITTKKRKKPYDRSKNKKPKREKY